MTPTLPVRLHLIRHGEVEARYQQFFGGSRIEMALSPLGHAQGASLGEWLATAPMDAFFTSPMLRVQQTISPLIERRGIVPTVLEDLREVDFGDWTGLRWDEVHTRFGVHAHDWLGELERGAIPGGESAADLLARIRPCLATILAASGQDIVVACHGGIVRALLALLLDLPMARMAHFAVDYGSLTTVELHPGKGNRPEIKSLNLQPHALLGRR